MQSPKASFVKRARMSAGAGPYLFSAGAIIMGIGLILAALHSPFILVMGVAAAVLQMPRQRAWETQNDMLEFASLAAMPLLVILLAIFWLAPTGVMSVGIIAQGLGGFFLALGVFHIITKAHTLRLADKIEQQP